MGGARGVARRRLARGDLAPEGELPPGQPRGAGQPGPASVSPAVRPATVQTGRSYRQDDWTAADCAGHVTCVCACVGEERGRGLTDDICGIFLLFSNGKRCFFLHVYFCGFVKACARWSRAQCISIQLNGDFIVAPLGADGKVHPVGFMSLFVQKISKNNFNKNPLFSFYIRRLY